MQKSSACNSRLLAMEFRESVASSIRILGDQVASLIVCHAQRNFGVDLSQVPGKVEKFDKALRGILGSGATVVVRECAKQLTASLGVSIEPIPDSLTRLYRKVSESYRLEKWVSPL